MRRKQYIFVDDSGDPGFKGATSANFVMSAVVFRDMENVNKISDILNAYHSELNWKDDYEFKFSKIRKDISYELLHRTLSAEYDVYGAYIKKEDFHEIYPIIDDVKLYNWMLKELLLMMPIEKAKIRIDGRSGKRYMSETKSYLRHQINPNKDKKIDLDFEDSKHNRLIQLADIFTGSINRSLQTHKTDSNQYIGVFNRRIVELKNIRSR